MGGIFSIENDFRVPSDICGRYSNRNIAYVTKQYVTLVKASNIMKEVIEQLNSPKNIISTPEYLSIPTTIVLADFLEGNPLESSKIIFGIEAIPAYENGKFIKNKYVTILDKYNTFFINEYNTLERKERIDRATLILSGLNLAAASALQILTDNCDMAGKTVLEMIQMNTPSTQ